MSATARTWSFLPALLVLWAIGVIAGMLLLVKYETTPGRGVVSQSNWPAASQLTLDPVRPTLVMFVHPRCPCTRAGIDGLARVITQCEGSMATHVLLLRPDRSDEAWEQTDLGRSVAAIPGVSVFVDESGSEAKRFGAETSGQVLLFSPKRQRLFQGGLSRSRGHAGDSLAQSDLIAIIRGESPTATAYPVFGCSLFEPPACPCSQEAP